MDLKTIKGKKHYIYDSEEEFHIYHPDYKNIKKWRDGREFDWVFTDDNCVVQILKRAVLKSHVDRKEIYIRTICGQRMIRDKRDLIEIQIKKIQNEIIDLLEFNQFNIV